MPVAPVAPTRMKSRRFSPLRSLVKSFIFRCRWLNSGDVMAGPGHNAKGLGLDPIMIVRSENDAEVTHGVTGCFNDIYNSVPASASQTHMGLPA
jgi:hypothetical protein